MPEVAERASAVRRLSSIAAVARADRSGRESAAHGSVFYARFPPFSDVHGNRRRVSADRRVSTPQRTFDMVLN
jgi:hypothetical protein